MSEIVKKGAKKMWLILVGGVVFLLLASLAINLFVIVQGEKALVDSQTLLKSQKDQESVPVLVLGAGVIDNRYPSQILKNRLDKALDLYRAGWRGPWIMSGDHREDNYNEVAVMKDYLVQAGIESDQIYLDHAGFSTYDSLYRLKHVLKKDQVILISQGYHLQRALMLAKSLGIEAVGLPAKETSSTRFKREGREYLARLKDFAVAYLGYRPTQPRLDQAFDLDREKGNQTNDKEALSSRNQ